MQRNRGKKIEWERLEISSRKLEYQGNIHEKIGTIKDRKKQKILRKGGKNTQKNYTHKILMTQITTMV